MGSSDEEQQAQRYENGHRLVVGCIPYKLEGEELKILMVRSQSGKNFVLPKGGWEENESELAAAAREAEEEAGVRGSLSKECVGRWIFYKSKRCRAMNPKGACQIQVFSMEVTEQLETWPEQHRERAWIRAEKFPYERCHTAWIRESLQLFISKLRPHQHQQQPQQQHQQQPQQQHQQPPQQQRQQPPQQQQQQQHEVSEPGLISGKPAEDERVETATKRSSFIGSSSSNRYLTSEADSSSVLVPVKG